MAYDDRHYLVLIERLVREGKTQWEIEKIVGEAARESRRPRGAPKPSRSGRLRYRRGSPRD